MTENPKVVEAAVQARDAFNEGRKIIVKNVPPVTYEASILSATIYPVAIYYRYILHSSYFFAAKQRTCILMRQKSVPFSYLMFFSKLL